MSAAREVDLARLRKPVQTVFGWLLFRRISVHLSARLARTRIRPAAITAAGLAIGLLGAALLTAGRHAWVAAGGICVGVAKFLDAVDGEVARATHRDTPAGYVADGLCDRLRDTAVLVGLTFATARGGAHAWIWGLVAIIGYLGFFYVSAAAPSHWREIDSERDVEIKHMFRVGTRLRLGAGDTLAVLVMASAAVNRPGWTLVVVAAAAPIALALKVRHTFAMRAWERGAGP